MKRMLRRKAKELRSVLFVVYAFAEVIIFLSANKTWNRLGGGWSKSNVHTMLVYLQVYYW